MSSSSSSSPGLFALRGGSPHLHVGGSRVVLAKNTLDRTIMDVKPRCEMLLQVASKRRAAFCGSLYGFVVSYARGVALVHEGSLRQGSKLSLAAASPLQQRFRGDTREIAAGVTCSCSIKTQKASDFFPVTATATRHQHRCANSLHHPLPMPCTPRPWVAREAVGGGKGGEEHRHIHTLCFCCMEHPMAMAMALNAMTWYHSRTWRRKHEPKL